MATNKINWISILQGWAMFLVVLGHCSIWTENKWCMDFCYGVHMPLFMFISGGLFYMTRLKKDWQWKDVAIDKLKRLGIPYVFFITFAYGLKVALANKVKHGVSLSLPDFLEGFVYPMNSGMKEMWFVAALLLIMFAFPIYKKTIYKRNICLLVLMVAMLMPCIFNSYIGGGLFNWQGAIRYFVFFYAGMLFFKFDLVNRLNGISGGANFDFVIYRNLLLSKGINCNSCICRHWWIYLAIKVFFDEISKVVRFFQRLFFPNFSSRYLSTDVC